MFWRWWGVNNSQWHFYPIQFIMAIVDWHLIWSQLTKSHSRLNLLALIWFSRIFDFMEDNPWPLHMKIIFPADQIREIQAQKIQKYKKSQTSRLVIWVIWYHCICCTIHEIDFNSDVQQRTFSWLFNYNKTVNFLFHKLRSIILEFILFSNKAKENGSGWS